VNTTLLPCLLVVLGLALAACRQPAAVGYPWLDTLEAGDGAKVSGKRLMSLNEGLSRVDRVGESTLLIGVHGYRSEGYEWVHPLQRLDNNTNQVDFFRWDWSRCPAAAAAELDAAIGALLDAHPRITRVVLVGHSLGGLVVADVAYAWKHKTPLEAHVVASPLLGIGEYPHCPETPLSARVLAPNASFVQWRTRHELDTAFKDMKRDPQIVDLKDSKVTLLPETYRGQRLGHNWSLSWVADKLAGDAPPP
jgi:pimeloyl-ACP methyl ester carboxylesterase